jgi:hypothetical protein
MRRSAGWNLLVLVLTISLATCAISFGHQKASTRMATGSDRKDRPGSPRPGPDARSNRLESAPRALDTIPVPEPSDISEIIRNRDAAIVLGKSLFWDMQVGSDGRTACASCHFSAGADNRIQNSLHPGIPGSAFGPQQDDQAALGQIAAIRFQELDRPNTIRRREEFPFHQVSDPTGSREDNEVLRSSPEISGSAGVKEKSFVRINENSPVDTGNPVNQPGFSINAVSSRQVDLPRKVVPSAMRVRVG